MNYTTKVGMITYMTCTILAAPLTIGEPIRRQAVQSEKTVPIGGNVTLPCPLSPDDTWIFVYWKKNNHTIYSLEVKSNTSWTNDTRYEGSNHATRLTIKDLKKTDSGIYHCKVATLFLIKERGQVLLSVTDQEVGLSTSSPGDPSRASTMIPTQPAEYNTVSLKIIFPISIINCIIITVIIMCLGFKFRQRLKNLLAGFVDAFRRLAGKKSTSTPVASDSAYRGIRDKKGTHTTLISSDTCGRDDVEVDDRPEESSNASQALESTQTFLLSSDTRGRDDVDVDDRPEESSNASQALAHKNTSTPLDPVSSHLEIEDEAPISTSTPSGPDSSHHEIRDEEGTRTELLSSDTHDRDDVDVDDRPEESSNASQALKICKTDD